VNRFVFVLATAK